MPNERERKRAKFARQKASGKKTGLTVAAVLILVLAAGGYFLLRDQGPEASAGPVGGGNAAPSTVSMTDVPTPAAAGGRIQLSLSAIKANRLIWTSYGANKTPLMAYVAPSGKIVTAISMCEPCRSERFHIEGNELVCNACGTRWTLEDLRGISGGCPDYPPDQLQNKIAGDTVSFSEQEVLGWQPRV